MARAVTLAFLLAIARVASAGIELTDPVYGPVAGSYGAPVATNGSVFLALWNNDEPQQVRGSLSDASGRPLTPLSFLVLPNASVNALTSAGGNFVVAWSAWPNSHLSLLDASGHRVRDIATLPYFTANVKIAASGDRILIASSDGARVVGTVVAFDGTIISNDVVLSATPAGVDAIATTDGFSVSVGGNQSVTLLRLSRDGVITASDSLSTPSDRYNGQVSLASSGAETLMVWLESTGAPGADRIAWAVFPGGLAHTFTPSGPPSLSMAEPFWTGTSYAVVVDGPPSLLEISRSGEQIAFNSYPINLQGFSGANIGLLLYSTAFANGTTNSRASSLIAGGSGDPNVVISTAAESQFPPGLASDGTTFAASWFASTGLSSWVEAARFTGAGARLDPAGVDAGAIHTISGNGSTRIAAGGSMYLLAWYDQSDLLLRRIASSGAFLDAAPVAVHNVQSPPTDIAWNGTQFLVVWPEQGRVAGVFVSTDGKVEAKRFVSPPAAPNQYAMGPAVAWDGHRFLVAWRALQGSNPICGECPPIELGLRAVRVSATGDVIDTEPAIVSSSPAFAHVASSGSDFLVVADSLISPYMTTAYLITGDTAALYVPKPIAVAQWSSEFQSAVAWDGRDYVVAIQYRLGGAFPTMLDAAWLATIRVSRSGVAHDARVRPSGLYPGPAIAADAAGRIAVAAAEDAQEVGAWRVRAYFDSDFAPAPAPPSDPTNVTTTVDGDSLVVSWTPTSTTHAGFVIDLCYDNDGGPSFCVAAAAPADATTIRLWGFSRATRVHVSAANAGGTPSAPLIPQVPLRRRATGR